VRIQPGVCATHVPAHKHPPVPALDLVGRGQGAQDACDQGNRHRGRQQRGDSGGVPTSERTGDACVLLPHACTHKLDSAMHYSWHRSAPPHACARRTRCFASAAELTSCASATMMCAVLGVFVCSLLCVCVLLDDDEAGCLLGAMRAILTTSKSNLVRRTTAAYSLPIARQLKQREGRQLLRSSCPTPTPATARRQLCQQAPPPRPAPQTARRGGPV
jgi:hypothetical protein